MRTETCRNCRKISLVMVSGAAICPRCDGNAAMIAVKNETKRKEEEGR